MFGCRKIDVKKMSVLPIKNVLELYEQVVYAQREAGYDPVQEPNAIKLGASTS